MLVYHGSTDIVKKQTFCILFELLISEKDFT